ncbi:aspartate carbamoyltransferase regulatory subunit [Acidaminobacter sp. JC074]|uniref:aspartate carbamoyltransferase regulatory subunit n=1 Tax=Acidaminobacter sp. JC074 TaxID=2530199 RepID=UPI001F10A66F|nr:aspartate carbamoyltransferase regulatory subunit [Acidaminobacter sp. JC074]MCH4890529.1 aspartate carbamoyltransferase regulatory subunit [Acidaminobacter sp. JC074]
MLEVKGILNGVVLDHIKAGKGLEVFHMLGLDKIDEAVVLLMNVDSKDLGKKDIIKIENRVDFDFNILSLIDTHITVNIIKDDKRVQKFKVEVPENIIGQINCKNPRCITNFDDYIKPTFHKYAENEKVLEYVCEFCEEITKFKK